jgi:hypothetical protein
MAPEIGDLLVTYHYHDSLGIREDHTLRVIGEDDLTRVPRVGWSTGFRGVCSLWPLQKRWRSKSRDEEHRDHLCICIIPWPMDGEKGDHKLI